MNEHTYNHGPSSSQARIEQETGPHNDITSPIIETEQSKWRKLFEFLHRNTIELLKTLKESKDDSGNSNLALPEFNPDKEDANAEAWSHTVDFYMLETPITGRQLMILLSKALKGSAATWLVQNFNPDATWPQTKSLFLARFGTGEMPAATLYKILTSHPNEGENISSYVSRILSDMTNHWRNMSTEQIAICVALAHASQIDTKLQRLVFTTEINSKSKLQQELLPFVYRKRSLSPSEKICGTEAKKGRFLLRICCICGKADHHSYDCRRKSSKNSSNIYSHNTTGPSTSAKSTEFAVQKNITCCRRRGESNHNAPRCLKCDCAKHPIESLVHICTNDIYNLDDEEET